MKIYKSFIIFFIINCLFFSACSTRSEKNFKEINTNNGISDNQVLQSIEKTKHKTELLLKKTLIASGGYAVESLYSDSGSLYSTYFALKGLNSLGKKVSQGEKEEIILFVSDQIRNLDIQNSSSLIYDLFYATNILKLVDDDLKNKNIEKDIMKILDSLDTTDGYFLSSHLDDKNESHKSIFIVPTIYSIYIYNYFNIEYSSYQIDWLKKEISSLEVNNDNITLISHLHNIKNIIDISKIINNDIKDGMIDFNQTMYENKLNSKTLFDLQASIRITELLNINIQPNTDLINELYHLQNEDGGWHVFHEDWSEEQGISIALEFINFYSIETPSKQELLKLVENQKAINGSYTSIYKKEFSLSNTFYATKINKFFGFETEYDDRTKKVIQNMDKNLDNYNPMEQYYLVSLVQENDIPKVKFNVNKDIKIDSKTKMESLRELLYINKINIELNEDMVIPRFINKKTKLSKEFTENILIISNRALLGKLTQEEIDSFWNETDKELLSEYKGDFYVTWLLSVILKESGLNNKELRQFIIENLNLKIKEINEKDVILLDEVYFCIETIVNLELKHN